jgi:hypothetical protein
MLHLFGLVVVRRDGSRASRGRVLWRNFLAGLPFCVLPVAVGPMGAAVGGAWAALVVLTGLAALSLVSALLPERSLQDRLAGTWLVPK